MREVEKKKIYFSSQRPEPRMDCNVRVCDGPMRSGLSPHVSIVYADPVFFIFLAHCAYVYVNLCVCVCVCGE